MGGARCKASGTARAQNRQGGVRLLTPHLPVFVRLQRKPPPLHSSGDVAKSLYCRVAVRRKVGEPLKPFSPPCSPPSPVAPANDGAYRLHAEVVHGGQLLQAAALAVGFPDSLIALLELITSA